MSFLSDIFGSKPDVPALKPIDIAQEQQDAVAQNLAVLPSASKLAAQVNTFNQDQLNQMLAAVFPDVGNIRSEISKNILSLTRGEIPEDVSQRIQNSAVAKALGGGYAGSGMNRNLVARDLGLTSLQLTQQGMNAAESWLKTARSTLMPEQFNVSSMFFTPQQRLAHSTSERNMQFQREWMQNQVDAMPDPITGGLFNLGTGFLGGVMGSFGAPSSVPDWGNWTGTNVRKLLGVGAPQGLEGEDW